MGDFPPRCDDARRRAIVRRPNGHAEASAAGQEVFRKMLKPAAGTAEVIELILSEEVMAFWAEHPERATTPSAMAALGASKNDRDYLGRWPRGGGHLRNDMPR
eukprot:5641952-Pyramimonas_sp.AAC.1